jgi:sodium transport system permease protein
MSTNSILTIYQKEMLELTRDRRTLISMIALPLIAIPVLFLVTGHFISSREKTAESEAMKVAVPTGVKMPGPLEKLRAAGFQIVTPRELRAAVETKEAAAAIEEGQTAAGDPEIRIYADQTRDSSSLAASKLRAALDELKDRKCAPP